MFTGKRATELQCSITTFSYPCCMCLFFTSLLLLGDLFIANHLAIGLIKKERNPTLQVLLCTLEVQWHLRQLQISLLMERIH